MQVNIYFFYACKQLHFSGNIFAIICIQEAQLFITVHFCVFPSVLSSSNICESLHINMHNFDHDFLVDISVLRCECMKNYTKWFKV